MGKNIGSNISRTVELGKSQEVQRRIIQKGLKMRMIKKYLKKHIYLQKKDRKLLMIWDYHNSIIMEYQRIINLLDNTWNQPSKYKTKNWVQIIDEPQETYNEDNQIRHKSSMLRTNMRCIYTC